MAHREHQSCIEACVRCAEECEHCATACLSEPDVKMMAECIRLDGDCAAACWLAAGFMSRADARRSLAGGGQRSFPPPARLAVSAAAGWR